MLGSDQNLTSNGVGRIAIFWPQKSRDLVEWKVEKSHDPVKWTVKESHDPVKWSPKKFETPRPSLCWFKKIRDPTKKIFRKKKSSIVPRT